MIDPRGYIMHHTYITTVSNIMSSSCIIVLMLLVCLALQADNVKQLSQGVKASMAAFWTPDRLHQLCRTLAYHFFTLTVLAAPATPHCLCYGLALCAEPQFCAALPRVGMGYPEE